MCFLCGSKHKWCKLMTWENPATFKEEGEWPDKVAIFHPKDRMTEAFSNDRVEEDLAAAVETMSFTRACLNDVSRDLWVPLDAAATAAAGAAGAAKGL